MFKRKYQQNQSVVADEGKHNVVSDSQNNATQPVATTPQEHGRSMTEMLGVLAVLGVLSIGGVQGYRYAMNKYTANQLTNELNIINFQIASYLQAPERSTTIVSLGTSYDNNKTQTSGYAFAYNCGHTTDINICPTGETKYFMQLSGVDKNICKIMTHSGLSLDYLVGVKNFENPDNQESLCENDNNQLTFLFDISAGTNANDDEENTPPKNPCPEGTSTEGAGHKALQLEEERFCYCDIPETVYIDEVCILPPCPNGTSTDGEGALAVTLTDFEQTQCLCEEKGTTYQNGSCVKKGCTKNSACGSGMYCHILNYTGTPSTSAFAGMKGECRPTDGLIRDKPDNAPFYLSKDKMMWINAKNLCSAMGYSIVSISDYKCDYTFCNKSSCTRKQGGCYNSNKNTVLTAMKDAYGAFRQSWVSDTWSTRYVYRIDTSNYVDYLELESSFYAVCKD